MFWVGGSVGLVGEWWYVALVVVVVVCVSALRNAYGWW